MPLFAKRLGRLSLLAPELQLKALEGLDGSQLAPLLALPKAMLSLVYYEHPDAMAETGYDKRPLIEKKLVELPQLQVTISERALGKWMEWYDSSVTGRPRRSVF